jgi:hypothetical protein
MIHKNKIENKKNRVLVLHRIPYHKIDYHLGFNEEDTEVTFFGKKTANESIPSLFGYQVVERTEGKELVVDALETFGEKSGFTHVFSLSEYELLEAARLREAWGISGASVGSVLKVRDKILMKNAVKKANLRVPSYFTLLDFMQININKIDETMVKIDLEKEAQTPRWILKPISGASSENTRSYVSTNSLREWVRDQLSPDEMENYEVEEFINQPIIHFDGIVERGKVKSCLKSRYFGTCLDYVNLGKPLGSYQCEMSLGEKEWVEQIVAAVEIKSGCFHLEAFEVPLETPSAKVFQDPESVAPPKHIFLEIANRVGGGEIAEVYKRATGIHLPSTEIKCLMGEPWNSNEVRSSSFYGFFVYPTHHLKGKEVRLVSRTKAHESLPLFNQRLDFSVKNEKGQPTFQAIESLAAGCFSADSEAQCQEILASLFEDLSVEEFEKKDHLGDEAHQKWREPK